MKEEAAAVVPPSVMPPVAGAAEGAGILNANPDPPRNQQNIIYKN